MSQDQKERAAVLSPLTGSAASPGGGGGGSPMVLLPVTGGVSLSPVTGKGHQHQHDHDHGIACACGHDHGEEGHSHSGVGLNFQLTVLLPLSIACLALAGVLSWMDPKGSLADLLGLLATAIAGGPIIWSAIKGLSRGQTNVNELVAMSIIGAVGLGWYVEAGLVALILQIGALIEGVATESAREAVLALQKLAPRHARVRREKQEAGSKKQEDAVIPVEEVKVGDILVVQAGERIAADGVLVSGTTSVDESSVTGESLPVDKAAGGGDMTDDAAGQMLAGTINLTGSVEIRVEKVGEHSALGHTIALVRRAQQFQPQIIRAADRFFAFYTPIILIASVIVWIVTKDPVRMVTMWVVGCPCAMLLASPLAIVVALARASRSGMQVKAGPFVEASANIQTVVFDKTGTLTSGRFVVSAVKVVGGGEGAATAAELLRIVATIEQRSSHPLARSIVAYAKGRGVSPSEAVDVQVLEGLGVRALIDGRAAIAGSAKIVPGEYAAAAGALDDVDGHLSVVPVYVVVEGRLLGAIYLTDEIRPEAAKTIRRLRDLGVRRVVMLTGDRRRTAELVGREVGCDEVFAELLPAQKVDIVRGLQRGGKAVCMVGDGINDAPCLAAATVGVAMGIRGTDVAIEAADAVLLKDDLTRLPLLMYLAKRTHAAIYQNLAFSVVFAGVAEGIAAAGFFGWVTPAAMPVVAAIIHIAAVVVIAVNSVRLAGGHHARPKPVEEPMEEDAGGARKKSEREEFMAVKLTPLQPV